MTTLKTMITTFIIAAFSLSAYADEYKVISASDIQWGLLNPARGDSSPKAANLWGDRKKNVATGMLVKFEKGFSSPPHIHNISYRGVVIEGLIHNDDPSAEKMWLTPGSFWTQPAGENHITAANGESNLIYLEIDAGPYFVQPAVNAFDNGERPINVETSNLVWLTTNDVTWVNDNHVQIAYLWGETGGKNGTFVRIPENFDGYIEGESDLKAVVIKGKADYMWNKQGSLKSLLPGSFFSSMHNGKHFLNTQNEVVLYVRSNGKYSVK